MLSLGVVAKRESRSDLVFVTGFVLEYREALYWITAGHCLTGLDELRGDPAYQIISARLYDNHSDPAAMPIPVTLAAMEWDCGSFDDADVGIMRLGTYEVDVLRANPEFEPLRSDAWEGKHLASPSMLFIFGFPGARRDEQRFWRDNEQRLWFSQTFIGLSLARTVDREEMSGRSGFWSHAQSAYGVLDIPRDVGQRQLANIEGMSGGPVISTERTKDGRVAYRLWGIQSSWDRQSATVRMEQIEIVLQRLEALHSSRRPSATP